MNTTRPLRPHCRNSARRILLGGCAGLCLPVFGQEPEPLFPDEPVRSATAAEPVTAESLGDTLRESAEVEPGGLEALPDAAEPAGQPGSARRWRAVPRLALRVTYDDNIFIQRDDTVADLIFSVAPGIRAGFWGKDEPADRDLDPDRLAGATDPARGHFLVADYTAILLGFARTSSENSLDHEAQLAGQWQLEKLTLAARSHFSSRSETNTDVGDRLRHTSIETELSASYQVTEKTALETRFFHTFHDYEGHLRATEWRNETDLGYAFTPLLRASFGFTVGRVEVEDGSAQVFERILARAVYSLSEKVTAGVRGGVEFRQSDGEAGDRVSPIFELSASYEPAAGTRIEVEAFRRVETSALLPDQDFTVTGIGASVSRTVGGGFQLSLAAGYRHADYTDLPGEPGRTDRYFFIRPGILYRFARWGSAELGYQFRANRSTRRSSEFENNQATLEVSMRY